MKRIMAAALAVLLAIAALLALALALTPNPSNAQTSCPQCHVNTTLTFKSTSGEEVTAPFLSDRCRLPGSYGSYHPAVCVGCGNSSNLVSCPTSYQGSLGSTAEGSCYDVLTSSQNCGSCGNYCNGGSCVNGQCTCDPSSPYGCGFGGLYFCNNVTNVVPKCEPNPTNKCPPTGLVPHNTSDFSVDLYTDAACSSCSEVCSTATNYTCVQSRAGTYQCAQQCSQDKCPSDTPFCSGGSCVQCRTSVDCLSGEVCNPTTHTCVPGCRSSYDCLNPAKPYCDTTAGTCGQCAFQANAAQSTCPAKTFCSNSADTKNQCLACPSGTYSISMKFGNETDCSSDLTVAHGRVSRCGGYNVPTTSPHPALTCCHGTPKCGSFANPSNGTDDECAAASTCGEREYCDRAARKCMPLPFTNRYPFGNCQGIAADSGSGTPSFTGVTNVNQFYASTPTSSLYCGTCDGSQAVVNPNNTNQATCPLFNDYQCGASKTECVGDEVCFNGKCVYFATSAISLLFAYNPYTPVRPQGLHGVSYQSDSSCTSTNSNVQLYSGWTSFFTAITNSFAYCANTAGVTSFSYSTIADPAARLAICPGGKDQCTPEFCTELFANVTKFQPTLCKTTGLVLGQSERCMLGVRVPDVKTNDPVGSTSIISQASTYDYCVFANTLQAAFYGCMGVDAQNATVVDSATGLMPPGVTVKGCTSILASVSPLSAASRPVAGGVLASLVLAVAALVRA